MPVIVSRSGTNSLKGSSSPEPNTHELRQALDQAILKVIRDFKIKKKNLDRIKSLLGGAIISMMRNADKRNR